MATKQLEITTGKLKYVKQSEKNAKFFSVGIEDPENAPELVFFGCWGTLGATLNDTPKETEVELHYEEEGDFKTIKRVIIGGQEVSHQSKNGDHQKKNGNPKQRFNPKTEKGMNARTALMQAVEYHKMTGLQATEERVISTADSFLNWLAIHSSAG